MLSFGASYTHSRFDYGRALHKVQVNLAKLNDSGGKQHSPHSQKTSFIEHEIL